VSPRESRLTSTIFGYLTMLRMYILGPQRHGHITVFPVVAGDEALLPYLTLEEASASGALSVQEKTGRSGLLLAFNRSPRPVLILNGEQPMGVRHPFLASQSMLLAPEDVTEVPVSPMRSPPDSRTTQGPGPAPHDPGPAPHDPGPVPHDPGAILHHAAAVGGPDEPAMPDSPRASPAPGWENAFPALERQVGLMAFLGPWLLGLDALGGQNLYASLHRRILEGYLMAARVQGDPPGAEAPLGEREATAVLALLERAERTPCPTVGLGEYSVFGGTVRGGELLYDDHLVHLSVLPATGRAPAKERPH
jgi:hypothetical protein